jgi:hypothetical protein
MGSFLENEANDDIPLSPPAHLTARDIIYEVDVATIEEEATAPEKAQGEPSENGNSQELFYDQSPGMPVTARQYGQVGNSARQEWMIKRRLGEDALGRSVNSSCGSSIRTELIPPGPGRLRLLSGITASFEPGTLTALMGSSGECGAGCSSSFHISAGLCSSLHLSLTTHSLTHSCIYLKQEPGRAHYSVRPWKATVEDVFISVDVVVLSDHAEEEMSL